MNPGKFFGKKAQSILKFNLVFIFIFLNVWDFLISRQLFNAMVLGIIMFAPLTFLWAVKSFKVSMLATFYAILLSSTLAVFFIEGYEAGSGWILKISFWLPYLLVAIVNAFWGLKIYSKHKAKLARGGA